MNIKTLLLAISILLVFKQNAQSQTKPEQQLSGIIADSASAKPMDYITVSLKNEKNVVKTGLSKTDGSFAFNNLKPAKYQLSVIAVGFKPKTLLVDLTDSTVKSKKLGTIYIVKTANKLKDVIITGDKPIITQEIDRLSYNLQADPESKSSNVLEMMRKVPLLALDGEENILLKGDKNFKILINGKPSSMVERNPKDILRSMPASSIQKIEVITTPPAKYDAEGLAGIINIITNKKVDNGYNGSLNLNERFPVGGPGFGGSFTFKQGKFGVSGFSGGSLYNTPSTNGLNSRLSLRDSIPSLNQFGTRTSDNRSGYFGGEISYEIDTLNLISSNFNINGNQNDGNSQQESILKTNVETHNSYNLTNNNDSKGRGLDLALNYQRGFKADKNRLLTFSYRYYMFSNNQFNNSVFSNQFTLNKPDFELPDYQQKNKGRSAEQTFQIDYAHPVKKLTIEAGVKGILRNNNSDFRLDSLITPGVFASNQERTNTFDNKQNILALYNSYQYNLKDWGFKGGLRLEQTFIDADFISNDTQLQKNYTSLVPSLSINKKLNKISNITFGYSRKIMRPGINQLNPFVDRSNPNFITSGNPDLSPSSSNNLELKYSRFKKGSVTTGVMYMNFNKMVMPMATLDTSTNISSSTFRNTGKANAYIVFLNANYPLTKKWNASVNGHALYAKVDALINNVPVTNDGIMYNASATTSYRFNKGWRVNASLNLNGPNLSLQGASNSFIGSSFSVNKDLVKDKLSFSAAANNPFAKYRQNINNTVGDNFTQENNNQTFFRTFNTSLNYRFGKLKSNLKKNKKGIINDDSGGGLGGG